MAQPEAEGEEASRRGGVRAGAGGRAWLSRGRRGVWGAEAGRGPVSPEPSALWKATRSLFTLSWIVLEKALV